MIPIILPHQILAAHLTNLYEQTTTLTHHQSFKKAAQDVKLIEEQAPDGILTAEIVDKWLQQTGIATNWHNVWNPDVPHFSDGTCPPDDTQDPNYGYIVDAWNCKRNDPNHKF